MVLAALDAPAGLRRSTSRSDLPRTALYASGVIVAVRLAPLPLNTILEFGERKLAPLKVALHHESVTPNILVVHRNGMVSVTVQPTVPKLATEPNRRR